MLSNWESRSRYDMYLQTDDRSLKQIRSFTAMNVSNEVASRRHWWSSERDPVLKRRTDYLRTPDILKFISAKSFFNSSSTSSFSVPSSGINQWLRL